MITFKKNKPHYKNSWNENENYNPKKVSTMSSQELKQELQRINQKSKKSFQSLCKSQTFDKNRMSHIKQLTQKAMGYITLLLLLFIFLFACVISGVCLNVQHQHKKKQKGSIFR